MYIVDRLGFFVAGLAGVLTSGAASAEMQFQDVSTAAGIVYVGESWGSSWGDYNADDWPDAFVSNHRNEPSIYVNMGDGTFEDRAGEVEEFQLEPRSDEHGASWSDFDNDGDYDLFISTGSKNNSQFLVNENGVLVDRTANYSFDVKSWGGRLPVWFDFTHDGKLDFSIAKQNAKPLIFEQTATDFVGASFAYGNNCLDTDFTQLADVTRDGILDWICLTQTPFPEKVYDISVKPFADRTSLFPSGIVNSIDSVFMDFDGDLVSDAFVMKGKERISGAEIVGPQAIEAHLIDQNNSQKGISFRSAGTVTVEFHWNARNISNIFIGASGKHPEAPGTDAPFVFTMSPGDPTVQGLKPLNSNPGKASVFVGYDPATQTWEFWNVAAAGSSYVYAFVDSTQPVTNLQVFGLATPLDTPRNPVFLGSSTGSYVDRTTAIGMNTPLPCTAVVAADFDNDMDLDLYMVCRNAVTNEANRLYENQNGIFTRVTGAGGAQGPTGAGVGLGENASIADYDVDGRVDVLSHNGLALFPEVPYSNGGPDKLFRNVSNTGNHWIELDLVGTTSNRDAVGARVIATAGGVSQLREQGGNYRRWTQNHKRLHFGLAGNATVDLQVSWPSGLFQTFTGLAADKLYRITEGQQGIQAVVPGPVAPSSCGNAAGLPTFLAGVDRGIFMGKVCENGSWQLRAVSPGGDSFRGSIASNQPFTSFSGVGLAGNDFVTNSNPNVLEYRLDVGGTGVDGINFSFPAGAQVCFNLNQPSSAPPVKVGNDGLSVATPFDLGTLGPCGAPPPLPVVSASNVAVSEGAGTLTFQVSLSKESSNTVTVNYATVNGTATAPQDYTGVTGTLTFTPGQTSKTVNVAIIDDGLTENVESFTLALSNPSGATPGSNGTGTINDNDGAPALPVVSANNVAVSEGAGTLTFQVNLSSASSNPVTVSYATVDGTATAPQDYTAVANTLTFTSGQTSKTVNVSIIDDALTEGVESFTLALSNPSGATLGSNGTGTINDNDGVTCGLASYNTATEQAVFIGRNCSSGTWQFRATAGGQNVTYRGGLVSNQPFTNVTGFSLETFDEMNWTSGSSQIDYTLNMSNAGQDGFNFNSPAGAAVCVAVDVPAGVPVYLGPARQQPAGMPFDLESGGPCM